VSKTEGYVKFSQQFQSGPAPAADVIAAVNEVRTRLFDLGFIGMDDAGIGFGNVSVRAPAVKGDSAPATAGSGSPEGHAGGPAFIVSGTATGAKRVLAAEEYATVTAFDIDENRVAAQGRTRASSESLSHGAVYAARNDVHAVIHVHSSVLFEAMLRDGFPKTSPGAEYGTPEIAREIRRVVTAGEDSRGSLVMGGHQDGVIVYAQNVERAEAIVMELARRYGVRA
jgi:ribulose-5-phosphate 4-epimerase/fuculose-1-phosphate aldolase